MYAELTDNTTVHALHKETKLLQKFAILKVNPTRQLCNKLGKLSDSNIPVTLV